MLDGKGISNDSVTPPLKTLNRHGSIAGDSETEKKRLKFSRTTFFT